MNQKSIICPACGSTHVTRAEQENVADLTLGEQFSFKEINYHCASCGEVGDFSGETDKNYLVAEKIAQSHLIKQLLANMHHAGITMAMFERIFELPARTLTRWKNGDFSASALALLRIVITYPWIVEVAENKFEKKYSQYAVVAAAALEFKNEIRLHLNQTAQITTKNDRNNLTPLSQDSVTALKVNIKKQARNQRRKR